MRTSGNSAIDFSTTTESHRDQTTTLTGKSWQICSQTNLRPLNHLNLLSQREVRGLIASNDDAFRQFRDCALAVLNTGNDGDDAIELFDAYPEFDIRVISQSRGLKLDVFNAPASAFVDSKIILGIQNHLFAALRDIPYVNQRFASGAFDLGNSAGITHAVFHILKNANVVRPGTSPNLAICWGGHSIDRIEYEYTKQVRYQRGLRAASTLARAAASVR